MSKIPWGGKKNGKQFVMGFSIETIVNAAKRALNLEHHFSVLFEQENSSLFELK